MILPTEQQQFNAQDDYRAVNMAEQKMHLWEYIFMTLI